MRPVIVTLALATLSWGAINCARSAAASQAAQQTQPPSASDVVRYEQIAQGVQAADLFRTEALRDLIVEVKDIIVGPRQSVPEIPAQGFAVVELKSGELETTIDGQALRRRPGEFWTVRPGQKYAVRNSGGMAVLHTVIFTKP